MLLLRLTKRTNPPLHLIFWMQCVQCMVQMLTARNPGCHRGFRHPMAMMLLVNQVGTAREEWLHPYIMHNHSIHYTILTLN